MEGIDGGGGNGRANKKLGRYTFSFRRLVLTHLRASGLVSGVWPGLSFFLSFPFLFLSFFLLSYLYFLLFEWLVGVLFVLMFGLGFQGCSCLDFPCLESILFNFFLFYFCNPLIRCISPCSLFRSVPLPVCPQDLHDAKTEEDSAPTVQLRGASVGIDTPVQRCSILQPEPGMPRSWVAGWGVGGGHSWSIIVTMVALTGMGRTMSSKRTRELN